MVLNAIEHELLYVCSCSSCSHSAGDPKNTNSGSADTKHMGSHRTLSAWHTERGGRHDTHVDMDKLARPQAC